MIGSSKVTAIYDAASAVVLKALGSAAITATTVETGVSLSELDSAYWHDGEIPHGVFKVNVIVSALDNTTGDETYTIDLVVDDVSNMSDTPRVVASLPLATKQTGAYTLYVDSKNIPKLDTDTSGTDKWLAARATLGGTTPSLTYAAWIEKTMGA